MENPATNETTNIELFPKEEQPKVKSLFETVQDNIGSKTGVSVLTSSFIALGSFALGRYTATDKKLPTFVKISIGGLLGVTAFTSVVETISKIRKDDAEKEKILAEAALEKAKLDGAEPIKPYKEYVKNTLDVYHRQIQALKRKLELLEAQKEAHDNLEVSLNKQTLKLEEADNSSEVLNEVEVESIMNEPAVQYESELAEIEMNEKSANEVLDEENSKETLNEKSPKFGLPLFESKKETNNDLDDSLNMKVKLSSPAA